MNPIRRLWKRMTWKHLLAIYVVAVMIHAVGLVGYAYYVISTKRVQDAIADNDIARMKQLLDEDPSRLNRRSHYGYTPLLEAAHWGRAEAIDELVRRGADLTATHRSEYERVEGTALHFTAYFGHDEATVALIRAGADVNAVNEAGETPLDVARRRRHATTADILRAAGGV